MQTQECLFQHEMYNTVIFFVRANFKWLRKGDLVLNFFHALDIRINLPQNSILDKMYAKNTFYTIERFVISRLIGK